MKPKIVNQYLTTALFQLMEKKDYDKITIQELVTKAGVCRASFYRNYLTKDQIIDEYFKDTFEEIYINHPLKKECLEDGVREIFADIYEKRETLMLLSRHDMLYRITRYVYQCTLMQIKEFDVLQNKYQPYFFAGASSAMLQAWIENRFEDSVEEVTDIFLQSLKGYMELEIHIS